MPVDDTFSVPAAEKKWQLGFWSLIATQFQGAFNENALKFLIIYLILAIEKDKAQRDQMELLVGVLFAAPFILFSLLGGYFADRFSKRAVTIWTKVLEVGVMLFAVAALAGPNLNLALAAIFLVCTQGALFGPSKYGLLPELLPPEKLSWGNGVLELGTFLAIIVGSMSGSFLAEAFNGREIYAGALLLGFTVIGLVWSFGIGRVPAADPWKKFHLASLIDVWSPMKLIRRDRVLWLAVLGNTYFFFVAGLLQFNIFIYGQDVLHIRSTGGASCRRPLRSG
jgi:acyl-[acyl-carrier-protein]-phospholipid O-acyltransferase/long-chain-fatty-acid--[acyl-carrier-protein] ligase